MQKEFQLLTRPVATLTLHVLLLTYYFLQSGCLLIKDIFYSEEHENYKFVLSKVSAEKE